MPRRALVIEVSTAPNMRPLPGAVRDVDAYVRFLTSKIGGGWNEETEITELHNPNQDDLTLAWE